MKWDRILSTLLLFSLCLAFLVHWTRWAKILVAGSALAVLVAVAAAAVGRRGHG